jgi:hypothetical protein
MRPSRWRAETLALDWPAREGVDMYTAISSRRRRHDGAAAYGGSQRSRRMLLVCLAVFACLGAAPAAAQETLSTWPPTSAAAVMEAFRTARGEQINSAFAHAWEILKQKERTYPRAMRDSVLDGLARIAIEAPDDDWVRGSRALTAISLAGSAEAREPHPRALEKLAEIARDALVPASQSTAVNAAYRLVDRPAVLRFWRELAMETPPGHQFGSNRAVRSLAEHGGEPGRAILRDLHARGLVTNRLARETLEDLARRDFRPGRQ